jgi:hypothetical protein
VPSIDAPPRHALPSAKIGVDIFRAHFCRYRRTNSASLCVPENLYPVLRGTEMRSNGARLPENFLFPDDASRTDLDALKSAKAKQDVSHHKLNEWIAAAIAELSGEKHAA